MSQNQTSSVFIGLGTNLGNRAQNLKSAIDLIKAHPQISFVDQSSIYENKAIEEAGPDDFFNQVVIFETSLDAYEFLDHLQAIERELDPQRNDRGRKKSRFIDLDILNFADMIVSDDKLVLPHPRMQERDFVMKPLNELQTKLYKEKLLSKNKDEDPAIKKLSEFSDFTRKLNEKEKLALEKINGFISAKKDFVFRHLLLEDLDQVLTIDAQAFGEKHWSRDTFVKELNNRYALYLTVTDKQDKILGFIGVWFVIDEMHIMTLAIDESAQRQGLAEALLLLAFKHSYEHRIRTSTLEVKASNFAAIRLYEKYLFKQQGIRKKYYTDGEAALLLWTEEIYSDEFLDNFLERLESLMGQRSA